MLPPDNPFRLHPVRSVAKALLVGALPGALVAGGLDHWRPPSMIFSASIGSVFSLVMWVGFETLSPWIRGHPARRSPLRAAWEAQGRWILGYTLLLGICAGVVRLIFGINLVARPFQFFLTAIIGLLITSLIVGFESMKSLLALTAELERAKAQAGFLALEAQLSPHTLFNALNTIAALIPEDPARAEAATEHLARFLRRVLAALERDRWSLEEEFALIGELLALDRLRFGERLTYELDLDSAEAAREIPPLLLLPLVENALKHGFRPKAGRCHLGVEARQGRVRVEDDGVGRSPEAPEGLGLRTVRQRLEAEGGMLCWPETDTGCTVELEWRRTV